MISQSGKYQGEVILAEPLGAETVIHIKCGEGEIVSMVAGLVQLKHGDKVSFDINKAYLHLFNEEGKGSNHKLFSTNLSETGD